MLSVSPTRVVHSKKGDSPKAHGPHPVHHNLRMDLRRSLLLLVVLVAGYGWGRTCLSCSEKRKGGSAVGDLDIAWVGAQEFARGTGSAKPLPQEFAQIDHLAVNSRGEYSALVDASLDAAMKRGGSSGDQLQALAVVLKAQSEEIRRQRVMLVENWRELRALKRHGVPSHLNPFRRLRGSRSSEGPHGDVLLRPRDGKEGCLGGANDGFSASSHKERPGGTQTKLHWTPHNNTYLLATCVYGRFSNRLMCLRNYVLAATVLQRQLIIPNQDLLPSKTRWNSVPEASYRFDYAFDTSHLNHCFATQAVVSLQKYLSSKKTNHLKVDKLLCWAEHCGFKQGKANLWPKEPKIALPRQMHTGLPKSATIAQFRAAYGKEEAGVLCLGDLFDSHSSFSDAPEGFAWGLSDGWDVPRAHQLTVLEAVKGSLKGFAACRALLWPHASILQAAAGFVHEVLGPNFAAIHLRRDDLFRQCVMHQKCDYWPQREVADCVLAKMRKQDLDVLFLASDSTNEDLTLFLTMLAEPRDSGFPIRVIRLGKMAGKMWAEGVNRAGVANEPIAIATVEKLVCALSTLFLSTPGSTFSGHIEGMRKVLGTGMCADGPFCQGIDRPGGLLL